MPQHRVQPGDTLSGIASRYQISVADIKAENSIIKNLDHIEAGWTLNLPDSVAKSSSRMPAPSAANDDSTGDVECNACNLDYTEMLHVTGENDRVYLLTRGQASELRNHIAELQKPLLKLREAEKGDESTLKQTKGMVWDELKKLNALPPVQASTTVSELMSAYQAKWESAERRLEHQRQRRNRIKNEIAEIQRMGLLPMLRSPGNDWKEQLTIRFFRALVKELEETLPDIEYALSAHEKAAADCRSDLLSLKDDLKQLRAALEAEVAYQCARRSSEAVNDARLAQLKIEADRLGQATQWQNIVSQSEIELLVSRQIRISEIEAIEEPSLWKKLADYFANSSPTPTIWSKVDTQKLEEYRALQSEREALVADHIRHLDRLVHSGPAQQVDMAVKPDRAELRSWPVFEVKLSGGGGYRYLSKSIFEQMRGNLKSMSMSDVRASMDRKAFKTAAGGALQQLNTNQSLQLKLAEWKSSEDNFFNRLNIELFEAQAKSSGGVFAADAESQMFRFACQAGLEAGYNPVKKEAHVGAKAEAAYSFLEGKASLQAQIPNGEGFPLELSYEDRKGQLVTLPCGLLRTHAEYKIQGFVGACATLASEAKISTAAGSVGLTGDASGEAFAGASLSNEAALSLQWKALYEEQNVEGGETSPSQTPSAANEDFQSLLDVKAETAISAGIGAGFEFKIFLVNEKLYLRVKGHLVLGPGGGGGVAAALNGKQILSLVQFIRWSLEHSDFRFLAWVEEQAFTYISWLLKAYAIAPTSIIELAEKRLDELKSAWHSTTVNNAAMLNSCQQVVKKENLSVLTPSSKAHLLEQFTRDVGGDIAPIVEAASAILDTITSHREFVEVLKRMGVESSDKGDFSNLRRQYNRLMNHFIFQHGERNKIEAWMGSIY